MAISLVGVGAQTANTTGTITCQFPSSYTAIAGDLALAWIVGRPTDTAQVTAPSGWTIRSTALAEVGANDLRGVLAYKQLTGAETGSQVFTIPTSWQGTAGGTCAQMAVYRGVDTTTPFDVNDAVDSGAAGFPTVPSIATTGSAVQGAPQTINLPTGIEAGDILLALLRNDDAGVHTWPAGWTELFDTGTDGANDQTSCAWRKADGTEGATIDVSTDAGRSAAIVWRIADAADPSLNPPESSTVAIGASTTPDPGALTPTGGAKNYLWFALGGWEGEQTSPPTYPANYTLYQAAADSGVVAGITTNCRVAGAARALNAASEDPGAFGLSASDDWTAATVAIHPADRATYTPPAVTTATDNARVVSFVGTSDDNALALDTANGFTARASGTDYDSGAGSDMAAGIADTTQTAAGAVTMPVWEQTLSTPDAWVAVTVALREAAAEPETPTEWELNQADACYTADQTALAQPFELNQADVTIAADFTDWPEADPSPVDPVSGGSVSVGFSRPVQAGRVTIVRPFGNYSRDVER